MHGTSTGAGRRTSATARIVEGVGATLLVGLAAWFTGANSIPPWNGLRIMPSSDLEFAIASILTIAASVTCAWRLISGSTADAELQRLAVTTDDDS